MTAITSKISWMDCLVTSWPPSSFAACHVSTAREAWLQMQLSYAALRVCSLQPSRTGCTSYSYSLFTCPAWCFCPSDVVVVGVSCWICKQKAATLMTAFASWIQLDVTFEVIHPQQIAERLVWSCLLVESSLVSCHHRFCGNVIWSFVFKWTILTYDRIHMEYWCIFNSVLWWYLTTLVGE